MFEQLWRSPRVKLLANGNQVSGCIDAQVTSTSHYGADRFRATVALGADLVATPEYWASESNILVDVQFSTDGGLSYVSLVQGLVDVVSIDLPAGLVYLEGRDLTSGLIETRTQETFANRTSSEIASILAERHSLTPVVADTSTPVGRYYQDEHDHITLNQFTRSMTEWDLITFLAAKEDYDVYVSGNSLHFQPFSEPSVASAVLSSSDFEDLRLERALTLARDITVTVKSWNTRQQTAFVQTARSSPGGGSFSAGPSQNYVYVRPNLTMSDALTIAQRKLAELSSHERVIEGTMPGELSLDRRSSFRLSGTGTDFDQLYFMDSIDRHLSLDHGFVQHIRAKNSSPRSQATAPSDDVGSVTG
ncbi:MAG: hypothetical protein JSR21_00040 [Proteobacteria bacterium]|nr:hypothetical protein [Pseudomonadota bacterium]